MPQVADPVSPDLDSFRAVRTELAELCRVHHVALETIARSRDLDDLLDRVLDGYEARLRDRPGAAGDRRSEPLGPEAAAELRALITFAAKVAALKERETLAAEQRRHAAEMEKANVRLEAAVAEAQATRSRLDGVLSASDSGILVLSSDGRVELANRAASLLAGRDVEDLEGTAVGSLLERVARGADGEVIVRGENGDGRVLRVARRELEGSEGSEVVLLREMTRRVREMDGNPSLERLDEVFRTLSVFSHKINNPLTALLGRAQILKAGAGGDAHVVKAATVIEESATRVAEMIKDLARVVKDARAEIVEKVPKPGDPSGKG